MINRSWSFAEGNIRALGQIVDAHAGKGVHRPLNQPITLSIALCRQKATSRRRR
jgi:hypothetical protein